MRNGYVINITAIDRPGIVAGVSSAIAKLDGNIESCSQTVLDGYFTLIMRFSLPKSENLDALKATILSEEGLEGCQAILLPTSSDDRFNVDDNPNIYVVTASGGDSKGIVSEFSRYLFNREMNIVDLYGNIAGNDKFVLIAQIEVDPKNDVQNIQCDLETLGEQLGFTVRIQHNNVFVATNQIRLQR